LTHTLHNTGHEEITCVPPGNASGWIVYVH